MAGLTISTPLPVATDEELVHAVIDGRRFSLFGLFLANQRVSGEMVVRGKTFRNSVLEGPCVAFMRDDCSIERCGLGEAWGDVRNLMLHPFGERVTGVLPFETCGFHGCQFVNVGFTGSPTFLKSLLRSARGADDREILQ